MTIERRTIQCAVCSEIIRPGTRRYPHSDGVVCSTCEPQVHKPLRQGATLDSVAIRDMDGALFLWLDELGRREWVEWGHASDLPEVDMRGATFETERESVVIYAESMAEHSHG